MKYFAIFVMLTNINHANSQTFIHLKYTQPTVATPLCGYVGKPSVWPGCFFMEYDLFNQPPLQEIEIWQDIPDYEGYYQVSNKGNVNSVDRYIICQLKNQTVSQIKGKPKKIRLNIFGYPVITLSRNGIRKHVFIHRLVALSFIPNPNNKLEINHINGIKTDNRPENLEWCTRQENNVHAYSTGLNEREKHAMKGVDHPLAVLNEEKVLKIRNMFSSGFTISQLSALYGVKYYTIRDVVKRINWKHI